MRERKARRKQHTSPHTRDASLHEEVEERREARLCPHERPCCFSSPSSFSTAQPRVTIEAEEERRRAVRRKEKERRRRRKSPHGSWRAEAKGAFERTNVDLQVRACLRRSNKLHAKKERPNSRTDGRRTRIHRKASFPPNGRKAAMYYVVEDFSSCVSERVSECGSAERWLQQAK